MTRRGLFGSVVALLAAWKLPGKVSAPLILHDDGFSDDTDALQAIVDRTGGLDGSLLPQREFRVSRPLQFANSSAFIRDMRFRWVGEPMTYLSVGEAA